MRRFDKTKNILNANILAEQRYLESKGLIKENELTENVNYTQEEYDEFFEEYNKLFNIIKNADKKGKTMLEKAIILKNEGVKFSKKIIKAKSFNKENWWENRFRKTTFFDFVDEESGEVYTFIADDEDWYEGMPILYPYSKLELSFLYENNLIDNAPKNAIDVIKFKNASPDLSNANLHSINEKSGTGEDFSRESAAQEYAMKSGQNMYNDQPDLNKEINTSEDNLNDPLFSHGVHFKSEYAMKGIPRPTIIIPFAIEGQKTIWYRHKDDKKKKEHKMSLDMFLNYYELKSKYK